MKKIELNVTRQLLEDKITVGQIIAVQEGDIRAIRDMIAQFIVDDEGNHYPDEAAQEKVNDYTLGELNQVAENLMSVMEDAAVPE